MVRTVLVTGGAGYIGSVLVSGLLQEGYRVRTIDNLTYSGAALPGYLAHPRFEFTPGDIRNANEVDQVLDGVEAVVHLAAIVGERGCRENPKAAREINKTAAEMLCEKALAHKVRRFVFASTCSNYGTMADNASQNARNGYVDETSPLHPISLYAELKVGFEQYLLDLGLPDFTPTCLRFATAYGLSGRPRFDLTVNEFVKELLLGRKLEVYGEQFWRPYCHVVDLARACVSVIKAEASSIAYRAFNVGETSENYQKKSLVEMILKELPDKRDHVAYVQREEDPRNYRVNCDKIKTQLGFSITKSIPQGIREILFGITSGIIENPDDPRYRNA